MDKLTRYNQLLLAVIGSIALIMIIFLLISGGVLMSTELFKSQRSVSNDPSLVAGDTHQPHHESVAAKDLVFETPFLLDTINQIYVIPVSQVNLKPPSPEVAGASFDDSEYVYSGKRYYQGRITGVYNNLVVYDQINNTKKLVFDKKVFISSLSFNTSRLSVIMEGTLKDTNKDNKLNSKDLQSFFIYSLAHNKLNEIGFDKMSAKEVMYLHDSDELALKFGIDANHDGEFSSTHEPVIFKIYNQGTGKIRDLVDDETIEKMRKMIN